MGSSQLPFWCFTVLILKNPTASIGCSLLSLGQGKEGRGSEKPSASEGSLAAGGGPSGRGPAGGFVRLAARLLLAHGFPSQVTGDHCRWRPGQILSAGETPTLWPRMGERTSRKSSQPTSV